MMRLVGLSIEWGLSGTKRWSILVLVGVDAHLRPAPAAGQHNAGHLGRWRARIPVGAHARGQQPRNRADPTATAAAAIAIAAVDAAPLGSKVWEAGAAPVV